MRREKIIRQGNLANVAAYGWEADRRHRAAVRGRSLSHHPGLHSAAVAVVTGVVMFVAQFAIGPALYAPLYLGQPVSMLPRMFADTTARDARHGHARRRSPRCSTRLLGVLALALFALIAVVPQTRAVPSPRAPVRSPR